MTNETNDTKLMKEHGKLICRPFYFYKQLKNISNGFCLWLSTPVCLRESLIIFKGLRTEPTTTYKSAVPPTSLTNWTCQLLIFSGDLLRCLLLNCSISFLTSFPNGNTFIFFFFDLIYFTWNTLKLNSLILSPPTPRYIMAVRYYSMKHQRDLSSAILLLHSKELEG